MSIVLPEIVEVGIFISNMWSYYKNKNMKMTNDRPVLYYEIDLPLMSDGIKYINGEPTKIRENMLILTKPGQRKQGTLPHRCHFIHFANEDSDIKHILDSLPNYIYNIDTESYLNIFSEISYHFNSKTEKDTILVQQLALKLLHMIIVDAERQARLNNSQRPKHINMQKHVEYIKNNLADDLSLATLAKAANFSPIYFHTCFKSYTGKTLREFVEEERIKKACILLSANELSIEKIAEICGFTSRSYFCVVFKRKMNISPREYSLKTTKSLM